MTPSADYFSAVARAYASWRPQYPDTLFEYLATLPARRELAWDCGAGSGQATLPLTRYFRRVVATDTSAAQLAAAPSHPQVEYRVAPAEASGFEPSTVDLVTVAQALHWFDLEAFYAEVDRVLTPGGVVAVWTYSLPRLDDERLDRMLQTFYRSVVGSYWPPERRHVENGYRELAFPFVEFRAPAFEMQTDWTLPALVGYLGTWSAVVCFQREEGYDPVEPFARRLEPLWGPPEQARPIRWPLYLRSGRRFP